MAVVCPSVRLVRESKSRMEGCSKLKIGRKEADDTGDPWPHLEIERSEVKVSRPINAETVNAPYLPNGETDELQTRYGDGVWRPASSTCAATPKVKVQGYNVMSSVWRVFAHNTTKKSHRSTTIGRKVVHISSKVERSKSPDGQMHYRPHSLLSSVLETFSNNFLTKAYIPASRLAENMQCIRVKNTASA